MLNHHTNTSGPRAEKAVILARVSSKEQEAGYSIDAQLHRLDEYCTRRNLDVIERFTLTESSTRGDRKCFNDMIAYIKKQRGPIALVADKVDRVQRSFREYPLLDALIQDGQLELHFNTENYVIHKDSVSQERLMWSMGVVMSQSYVETSRENILRSQAQKIRQGEWNNAAPLGYLNTRVDTGKVWITIDPLRGPLVKALFDDYATGLYSLAELVERSKSRGLKNKHGLQGYLSKQHIHKILNNPFYYGVMRAKGELHPHVYECLIDKALFDHCQAVMTAWHKKSTRKDRHEFTFRGLITCATSGRTVSSEKHRKNYKSGGVGEWVYLRCWNPDKPDKNMWVREEKIMKQVMSIMETLRIPTSLLQSVLAYFQETERDEHTFSKAQLTDLHRQKTALTKRMDRLIELLMDKTITQEDYQRQRSRLNDDMADIQAHIKSLHDTNGTAKQHHRALISLTTHIAKTFTGSKPDEKRQILKLLFSNLEMKGDKLKATLALPFSHMTNLSDSHLWCTKVDALRTCGLTRAELERLVERLRAIVNARQDE